MFMYVLPVGFCSFLLHPLCYTVHCPSHRPQVTLHFSEDLTPYIPRKEYHMYSGFAIMCPCLIPRKEYHMYSRFAILWPSPCLPTLSEGASAETSGHVRNGSSLQRGGVVSLYYKYSCIQPTNQLASTITSVVKGGNVPSCGHCPFVIKRHYMKARSRIATKEKKNVTFYIDHTIFYTVIITLKSYKSSTIQDKKLRMEGSVPNYLNDKSSCIV